MTIFALASPKPLVTLVSGTFGKALFSVRSKLPSLSGLSRPLHAGKIRHSGLQFASVWNCAPFHIGTRAEFEFGPHPDLKNRAPVSVLAARTGVDRVELCGEGREHPKVDILKDAFQVDAEITRAWTPPAELYRHTNILLAEKEKSSRD